jgi:hypothetical protein
VRSAAELTSTPRRLRAPIRMGRKEPCTSRMANYLFELSRCFGGDLRSAESLSLFVAQLVKKG